MLERFWVRAWGSPPLPGYVETVLTRSLAYVTAMDGDRLVGFVNVAWDGGVHAFVLDTAVDPAYRRQGIAKALVLRAEALARAAGAHWLHVDFEAQYEPFYRACGFRPTAAGLIALG
jgi:GNAT superfamily N-acetyltransferase